MSVASGSFSILINKNVFIFARGKVIYRGPRSNFEMGGIISDSILGGHKTLFLTNSYNFKILAGTCPHPPPPPNPRSLVYQTDTLLAFHAFELSPYFCSHFQFLALLSKEQRIIFHPETVSIHENECLSPRKKGNEVQGTAVGKVMETIHAWDKCQKRKFQLISKEIPANPME